MGQLEQTFLHGLRRVAEFQRQVVEAIVAIPGYHDVEGAARTLTAPVRELARSVQRMFPAVRRIEWLLETERLIRMNPLLLSVTLAFVVWRGLRPTSLGHIGTDTLIYPLLGAVSYFNPFLGILSGIAYGIGDLAQKLVWNDIYGATGSRGLNYWGAMLGYVFSYSSLVAMGLLPGVLARISRVAVRKGLNALFYQRASATADGAAPATGADAPTYPLAEAAGSLAGAALGGSFVMGQLAPTLESPAFYLRPDPDVSCHNLEVDTYLKGRALTAGGGGTAIGGTALTVATDPNSLTGPSTGSDGSREAGERGDAEDGGGRSGGGSPYDDLLGGGGVVGARPYVGPDFGAGDGDTPEDLFDEDGRTTVEGTCLRGHRVPVGSYFCPSCPAGKDDLEGFIPSELPPEPPPEETAPPSYLDADGRTTVEGTCWQGHRVPVGFYFCPVCHAEISDDSFTPAPDAEATEYDDAPPAADDDTPPTGYDATPDAPEDDGYQTGALPEEEGGHEDPPASEQGEPSAGDDGQGASDAPTYCAQCGQPKPAGAIFCPSCRSNDAGSLVRCPRCGMSLGVGSTSCWVCRTRFSSPLEPDTGAAAGQPAPASSPADPPADTDAPEPTLGDLFWPLGETEPEIFGPDVDTPEEPDSPGESSEPEPSDVPEAEEGSPDDGDAPGWSSAQDDEAPDDPPAPDGADELVTPEPPAQSGPALLDDGGRTTVEGTCPEGHRVPVGFYHCPGCGLNLNETNFTPATPNEVAPEPPAESAPPPLDEDGRTTIEGTCPKGHRVPVGFYHCPSCGTHLDETNFRPATADGAPGAGASTTTPGGSRDAGGGRAGGPSTAGAGTRVSGAGLGVPSGQDGGAMAGGEGSPADSPAGGAAGARSGSSPGQVSASTGSGGAPAGQSNGAQDPAGANAAPTDGGAAQGTGGPRGATSSDPPIGNEDDPTTRGSGGAENPVGGATTPGAGSTGDPGDGTSGRGPDTTAEPGDGGTSRGAESMGNRPVGQAEEPTAGGRDDDADPSQRGGGPAVTLGGVESGGTTTFDEYQEGVEGRPLGMPPSGEGTASDVDVPQASDVRPGTVPLQRDHDASFEPTGVKGVTADEGSGAGGPLTSDGHCRVCGAGPQVGPVCGSCGYEGLGKSTGGSERMGAQPPPTPDASSVGLLERLRGQGIQTGSVVDADGNTHVLEPSSDRLPDGVSGIAYQTKEVTLANGERIRVIDPAKPIRVNRS